MQALQAMGRLPGFEPRPRHGNALRDGSQRRRSAIDQQFVAARGETRDFDFQPFHRRIDIPHRAAHSAFLAHHMPRLQRLAKFQRHPTVFDAAQDRETELSLGLELSGLLLPPPSS